MKPIAIFDIGYAMLVEELAEVFMEERRYATEGRIARFDPDDAGNGAAHQPARLLISTTTTKVEIGPRIVIGYPAH
jgi:hypothetical protein